MMMTYDYRTWLRLAGTAGLAAALAGLMTGLHILGAAEPSVAAAPATQPGQQCVPPPAGLVGWWPLDEVSGTTAADLIGGNDGSHMNGPSLLQGPFVDSSRLFDGQDDYIEVPSDPSLELGDTSGQAGDFTIDAWVRLDADDQDTTRVRTIVDKRTFGPATGYAFYTLGGELRLQMADGGTSGGTGDVCGSDPNNDPCTNFGSGINIADGLWHFVAVSVDRDGSAFFVVDDKVGNPINAALRSGSLQSTAPLRLGRHSDTGAGYWLGALDEIELFDRALTQDELLAIFNAGRRGKCKDCIVGDDFDDDQAPNFGNELGWTPTNAGCTLAPGGPDGTGYALVCDDGAGASTVAAPQRYLDQINTIGDGCLTFCFDVYLEDDATDGASPDSPANFYLTNATKPNSPIVARFVGQPISEPAGSHPGWHRVCAPLHTVNANDPLPSNANGGWQIAIGQANMTDQANWNTLLSGGVTGLMMPVDMGSSSISERVHYDNFCIRECSLPRPRCASICGVKFNDLNADGVRQLNEPLMPGWTIELYDQTSGNVIDAAVTGDDGAYCLDLPAPPSGGALTVREVGQPLWTQTAPAAPGTYEVRWECYPATPLYLEVCAADDPGCSTPPDRVDFGNWHASDTWFKVPISRTAGSSALGGWPLDALVDDDPDTTWSSRGHDAHLSEAEWAAVVLPREATIDTVRVQPRVDPADRGSSLGFPKDLLVQYSHDSDAGDGAPRRTCDPSDPRFSEPGNWRPLATRYGFAQPTSDAVELTFEPIEARCVRVFGAELSPDDYGYRYLQLAGIDLLADGTSLRAAGVSVSSSLEGWPADALVDADPDTTWSSVGHGDHLAEAEWAAVLLPRRATLDTLRIQPRVDPTDPGSSLGFPKDLLVQYSYESDPDESWEHRTCDPSHPRFSEPGNWRPLVTRYSLTQPTSDAVELTFEPVEAGCVRVFGAELSPDDYGYRYLQLAGIDLLGEGTSLRPSGVAASSSLEGWSAAALVDADPGTTWSSLGHGGHLAQAESAAVLLDERTEVGRVAVWPRRDPADPGSSLGFPKDLLVQYAYSSEAENRTCDPADPRFSGPGNWRPLVTRYSYPQPTSEAIVLDVEPVEAECVRVLGAELSPDDYGYRYLQLAGIELWQLREPDSADRHLDGARDHRTSEGDLAVNTVAGTTP